MAITGGYFNSISGDRKYSADQMNAFFEGLVGAGVFENVGQGLKVTALSKYTIRVGTGRMVDSKGRWLRNDAAMTITLSNPDVTLNRYDAIVAAIDTSAPIRAPKIYVKKGTNGVNPAKPKPVRNSTLEEYILAYVHVRANVQALSNSDIMDTRPNNEICGFVQGLVHQVPTTELFNQYETAYEESMDAFEKGMAQFPITFNDFMSDIDGEYSTWFSGAKNSVNTALLDYDERFGTWFGYVQGEYEKTEEFMKDIQDHLPDGLTISQLDVKFEITADGTTDVPIPIQEFNPPLDLINVYINGFRLTPTVDYAISEDNSKIKLTKAVNTGTVVNFEVWRTINSANARNLTDMVEKLGVDMGKTQSDIIDLGESLSDIRIDADALDGELKKTQTDINDLSEKVKTLDEFYYKSTGENDNIKLCDTIKELVKTSDQVKIEIIGDNFRIGTPSSGSGTISSRYKYFEIGAEGKKVILDFGRCSHVKGTVQDNSIVFYGQGIQVENLKMTVTGGANVTFTENTDVLFEKCEVSVSGSGMICFAKKGGRFNNCRVDVSSSDSEAFCFEPTEGNFIVATGCRGLARKGTGTGVAAVGYIPSGLTNAVLMMTNCHCPLKAVAGTTQTNSIKINSGKFALYANVTFDKPSIYNASAGTESGTIVM